MRLAPPSEQPETEQARTAAKAIEQRGSRDSRCNEPERARAVRGRRGSKDYVTVTTTAADVCEFPAPSVAIAVSVCVPFVAFFVFQLTK